MAEEKLGENPTHDLVPLNQATPGVLQFLKEPGATIGASPNLSLMKEYHNCSPHFQSTTSITTPTRRQNEHFKEAQNLSGSTPRSYEDVISLLNLLSTAVHSQDQTGCSTSSPSAKVGPPSLLRHEETVLNQDVQIITKQLSYVISSSKKLQNHRYKKPLHKKASGSSGVERKTAP
ncbi:hypothetical protein VP01_2833g4, partial [Puccinia sorghi]